MTSSCFSAFGQLMHEGVDLVASAGTPVRAAVGDTSIELVDLDDDVDDDIFEPPADISSAE